TNELVINTTLTATDDPSTYSSLVNSLVPLGYWRLGESSGTTVYDETGTNDGFTVNSPTLGQGGALADEPANTAVSFDGTVNDDTSDFTEIAHDASYLLDDGTIQFWFNTSDVTQTAGLFSKDSSGNDTGGHVSIELNAASHVTVRLQSTTTSYTIESTTALTPGEWHHVAFTFGSGGMQLYVDGELEATNGYTGGLGTTSGGSGNAEPIALGAGTQTSGNLVTTGTYRHFDGLIDEVAIFGAALTPEQVRDLYGAAFQHYTIYQDTTLNTSAAGGVLANDYDADDDPLTAVLVAGPSNAQSFTLNPDGSFDYTPVAGFSGTDTFTYQANDGSSNSNLATVTLTVEAVATANAIWISTDSDTLAPGADGLPGGWLQGEVLEFGGVDLAFGASTDGDFASVIDFDAFALDATDVAALHFVSS
ncbi:MAG: LamG-like jellyroll fold domain-containing protein, partial [Pseudomonadales bacterium]